jgi:hypothetical protein
MSQQNFRKLTALSFCIALAACGGGGGGSDTPSSQTDAGSTSTPNGGTPTFPSGSGGGTGSTPPTEAGSGTTPPAGSDGSTTPPTGGGSTTPPSSGSGSGTPPSDSTGGNSGSPTTTPPASTFTAQLVSAPSDGFLDDYAEGTHPNDTVRFVVSGNGLRNVELVSANDVSIKYGTFAISADGTRATLDWPYKSFGHTYFDLRIVAWDVPAGEAGESIEVMPARRYIQRPSPGRCADW